MADPIVSHVVAVRRQTRRLHWVAVAGTVVTAATLAVLIATSPLNGLGLVLILGTAGYLYRTGRQALRTLTAIKQWRLEEQFLHHGPGPDAVRSCLWCRDHLWTHSRTLRGLKRFLNASQSRTAEDRRALLQRHYRGAFDALWPGRFPLALLWLVALAGGWLYAVPEPLFAASLPFFVSAGLLLTLLALEVLHIVLRADLRDGLTRFVTLLVDWTLARPFEEAFEAPQKHYQHTSVYQDAAALIQAA